MARGRAPEQRFWEKVDKSGDCWIWTGASGGFGYGEFFVDSTRRVGAHRYAYQANVGPIPDGMYVCHKCDNPACVRPSHLFIGSAADNNADRERKGRGSPPPRVDNSGIRNGMSKLTVADVLAIRQAAASGEMAKAIAPRYGISTNYISSIVTRRRWANV